MRETVLSSGRLFVDADLGVALQDVGGTCDFFYQPGGPLLVLKMYSRPKIF